MHYRWASSAWSSWTFSAGLARRRHLFSRARRLVRERLNVVSMCLKNASSHLGLNKNEYQKRLTKGGTMIMMMMIKWWWIDVDNNTNNNNNNNINDNGIINNNGIVWCTTVEHLLHDLPGLSPQALLVRGICLQELEGLYESAWMLYQCAWKMHLRI